MAQTLNAAKDLSRLQELIDKDEMSAEDLADTIESIEMELTDKIDAICELIEQSGDKADACKLRSQQYQQRQKMWENKQKSLRSYLLMCIQASGRQSVKTVYHTVSVKNGRDKVIVADPQKLHEDYQIPEITVKADSKKIEKAIADGLLPDGVTIEPGLPVLSIR